MNYGSSKLYFQSQFSRLKINSFCILFRQVIVGEHTLAEDPDCVNGGNFCLPKPQKFGIDKVTQHQNWEFKLFQEGYDIALVRIRGEIKLFVSKSSIFQTFWRLHCCPKFLFF